MPQDQKPEEPKTDPERKDYFQQPAEGIVFPEDKPKDDSK